MKTINYANFYSFHRSKINNNKFYIYFLHKQNYFYLVGSTF